MCCSDHANIISTVTNRQSGFTRHLVLNHLNDVGFLLGRYPADKYDRDFRIGAKFNKVVFEVVSLLDKSQLKSVNNDSGLAGCVLLLCMKIIDFLLERNQTVTLKTEPVLLLGQQLATLPNIDCSFNFVTS